MSERATLTRPRAVQYSSYSSNSPLTCTRKMQKITLYMRAGDQMDAKDQKISIFCKGAVAPSRGPHSAACRSDSYLSHPSRRPSHFGFGQLALSLVTLSSALCFFLGIPQSSSRIKSHTGRITFQGADQLLLPLGSALRLPCKYRTSSPDKVHCE